MRHAIEPQAAAVLLDLQQHRQILHRRDAILEDPPKPTLEDGSAVVPTCWSSLQVVGDRRGLASDVVEAQQGVREEGNPHLGVPRESFGIRPTPRFEAVDVETCDLCYFCRSEEAKREARFQLEIGPCTSMGSKLSIWSLQMLRCKG